MIHATTATPAVSGRALMRDHAPVANQISFP